MKMNMQVKRIFFPTRGGGAVTWVNICWVSAAGILEPLPHYNLFCPIIDPILVTFGQMIALISEPKKCHPILVTLLKMPKKSTPL